MSSSSKKQKRPSGASKNNSESLSSSAKASPAPSPTTPGPSPVPTRSFDFHAPQGPSDMYAFGSAATESSTSVNGQPPPSAEPELPETPEQKKSRAENIKERGNIAFKSKQYAEAIDLYGKAIDLRPGEAAYLTNRAAAYMALKRFKLALSDCQSAANLQQTSPQAKTLLRLARCQVALGQTAVASTTVSNVISLESGNPQAAEIKAKIAQLESHLNNFEQSKGRNDWGMARLALDKCFQTVEAEGSEVPIEWRLKRIEVEMARQNWEAAGVAANDAMRLHGNSPEVLVARGNVMFFTNKLPMAIQHAQSALRLDPLLESAQALRKRVKEVERIKEEGNTAFKAGRLEEALKLYDDTLAKIGEKQEEGKGGHIRATLLSNRATTLVKMKRHDEALIDTDAALVLLPTNFKTFRTRARIHLHAESYESAVADFKSALEFATEDADIRSLRVELKKAEADLKRSKTKDYYKILGLHRECSEIEIKKAYRKESLIHHPDKGGDEEKFKLVVEAHAVLSDPQKRARYDMGEDEDGMSEGMGGGHGGVDLSELFAQFHGGGGAFGGGGGGFGGFPGQRGHTHGFGY